MVSYFTVGGWVQLAARWQERHISCQQLRSERNVLIALLYHRRQESSTRCIHYFCLFVFFKTDLLYCKHNHAGDSVRTEELQLKNNSGDKWKGRCVEAQTYRNQSKISTAFSLCAVTHDHLGSCSVITPQQDIWVSQNFNSFGPLQFCSHISQESYLVHALRCTSSCPQS